MWKNILCAAAVLFFTPNFASARDDTVNGLLDELQQGNKILANIVFISGVTFMHANTILEAKGEKPLYCHPKGVNFTAADFSAVLQSVVKTVPDAGKMRFLDFPMILEIGLAKKFPCK